MTDLRAHHVGITVADLERAVEFYEETLGLAVLDRFTVSGENFSTAVGVEDATGRFVHLDGDGVRIELVEYDPSVDDGDTPTLNRRGAAHLGLTVDDVDAFYDSLSSDTETISPPQTTSSGSRILFVRDPEGNLIELLESSS